MAADVGITLVEMSAPTVGKRTFLCVVDSISSVMRSMTSSAATIKNGRRPFKKSAFGGEKTAACGVHSLTLPKGRECQTGELRIVIGEKVGWVA